VEAFGSQVAGIWTDLGEPERHPDATMHTLGVAPAIHNIFNLLWARTVFEGFNDLHPGRRVVNLTRSGFAGIQRYGVLPWSGDVARSFGGLAVQIPMMLGMGMSGLAYHNSDIGGYARMPTTPELYVRWMQYGVFCPITRTHGAGESVHGSPTEPWQFGSEAETICRELLRLRYRLIPYTYTYAHRNFISGEPLARPLFFLDRSDAGLYSDNSSYMWGDAFLVSPVVDEGQTSKRVRLPRGNWFDFWTDELLQGGSTVMAEAPLDRIPLFVREGSIVPMAPIMDYADQRALDTLTVHIYPSTQGESSFTLYEDDGTTLAYQQGAHALTTFTQRSRVSDQRRALWIRAGASQGSYDGFLSQRIYLFEIHGISQVPSVVRCNGTVVNESGTSHSSGPDGRAFWFDAKARRLFVQVQSSTDSSYEIEIHLPLEH
jgi:alpha-glucosidase (family GH31 glycosyl hydrolase)